MKNKVLEEVAPWVREQFGTETSEKAMGFSRAEFDRLCAANAGELKAVKTQTRNNLYPCLSLYRGMQTAGIGQADALAFLDRSWSRRAEKQAASIQALMKIPGLYRLMPTLYRNITLKNFGTAAGFRATFYPTGRDRCKFDMTRCLFCDICRREGCPELVPCFCHTDDVTSGHMHPRLLWNRTKTMGEGGDVCDFDLLISEK